MVSREEEMAKLKARYAQTRGGVVTPEKKEPVKRIAAPMKAGVALPRFDLKPYLHIMENDLRKLMGLPSIEEIKKKNTYDPLLETWKRSRNMK